MEKGKRKALRPRQGVPVPLETTSTVITRSVQINWEYLIRRRPVVLEHTDVPPYLLKPEIQVVLDAAKHANTHLLLNTLWHTGARISEALALTPAAVHLADELSGEVSLPSRKVRRGRPRRTQAKKPVRRLVPVRDARYIDEVVRYVATHRIRRQDKLFPYTRQAASKRLGVVLEQLRERGIEFGVPVSLHTFRHSFAVNALLHGTDVSFVQGWLGHAHRSTTEIYTQVLAAETGHMMEYVEY